MSTELNWTEVDLIIEAALREDAPGGDVTTNLLFAPEERATGVFRAKAPGVVAGLPVAERVFARIDPGMTFETFIKDGSRVSAGLVMANVTTTRRALLTGERIALNLLQRMSGIATLTAQFVEAVQGLPVKILDTRKTAPGLRILDKYAVRMGGARNHRLTLSDLAMVKDNHLKLAGGITPAVQKLRAAAPKDLRIEVECANLDQVREALAAGADIIMLDNMTTDLMREAVALVQGFAPVEASGNISLSTIREVAKTGVDFISVGKLTHSVPALDISMKVA